MMRAYLQYDTALNTWHKDWFPGSQCVSLTSKNQQQQIKLRFQDTSDIPKTLGQLITHFHPFMFRLDCFRLAQAMWDDVPLVTGKFQPGSQAISLLYLLPLPSILSDSPCLHGGLQHGIKDSNSPGKIFPTVTSLEKLAQDLPLSISFSFLDFTLPFPFHSQPTQNRRV